MEPGKARVTASVTELETARATASVTVLEMARATVSATVPGMAGAMAAATAGEGTAADKEKSGAIRLPLFFFVKKKLYHGVDEWKKKKNAYCLKTVFHEFVFQTAVKLTDIADLPTPEAGTRRKT